MQDWFVTSVGDKLPPPMSGIFANVLEGEYKWDALQEKKPKTQSIKEQPTFLQ